MCPQPSIESSATVLVVEDNPDLRRHLCQFLSQHGVIALEAKNEHDALAKDMTGLSAIVADIDLSEGGGDYCGGILLVKRLVEKGIRIPIILISCTPRGFLQDYPEYAALLKNPDVGEVLDRNSDDFREELMRRLGFPQRV